MEKLFHDRLPEFYETLAYHFAKGQSIHKAVDYLMKSGEKSLKRYALEEAYEYYKETYECLSNIPKKSKDEEKLLIDLLIKWCDVLHLRGEYSELIDLFKLHEDSAESLDDKKRLGLFYSWLGIALQCREKLKDAYIYSSKALKLGEEVGDQNVIGYAGAGLTWTCADLGLLEKAIIYGERAQEVWRLYKSNQEFLHFSFAGAAIAYYFRGDTRKTNELGKILLDYGHNQSNPRCLIMGHQFLGWAHLAAGDLLSAIKCFQKAIQVSSDPLPSHTARFWLGMSYAYNMRIRYAYC